jgi:hypothetical protein
MNSKLGDVIAKSAKTPTGGKMAEPRRCTNCILPESYPGIKFNNDGICNVCISAFRGESHFKKKSKDQLDEIILKSKGLHSKYDAIVPLSGGKDSTYVAYYLKKK